MAIRVTVRCHNMLRHHTGVEQEVLALPEGTLLRAALEEMAARHGPGLRQMLFAGEGAISPHLVVFANQRLLPRDGREAVVLADGDELLLFPAISGG